MKNKISFADLTHTGQLVSANATPLGIAMVASYATKELGDEADIEIFKYPEDFSLYLSTINLKLPVFPFLFGILL